MKITLRNKENKCKHIHLSFLKEHQQEEDCETDKLKLSKNNSAYKSTHCYTLTHNGEKVTMVITVNTVIVAITYIRSTINYCSVGCLTLFVQ